MSPLLEMRHLLAAYGSDQVQVVLDVWRRSHVRVDRASAVGLRRAIQVEVLDYAQNRLGLTYDEAYHLATKVAVAKRRHVEESRTRPELRAAIAWEFTVNGDDEDGEWERIDAEEPS